MGILRGDGFHELDRRGTENHDQERGKDQEHERERQLDAGLPRELLRPLRELGPGLDTFAMGPPTVLSDLAMDPPEPLPFMTDHRLLGDLPAPAVDDVVAAGAQPDSPLALLQFRHMGGAIGRRAPGAGARAMLPGEICMFAGGIVAGGDSAVRIRATLDAIKAALSPHEVGYYPNFVEHPVDASAFFDPVTWARLRRVKALYDPEDRDRGYVTVKSRRDGNKEVGLVTVSIGVALSTRRHYTDPREIIADATEMKSVAKNQPGSYVAVDRRSGE